MADKFPLYLNRVPGAISFPVGINDDNICTTVNYPFLMAETPVTYEFWTNLLQWATHNSYLFKNDGMNGSTNTGYKTQPVTMLNWWDAIAACNALTEYYNMLNNTELTCVYLCNNEVARSSEALSITDNANITIASSAKGFRLPTSMEWELAARYIDGSTWTPGNYASGASKNYQNKMETQKVACYEDNSNMTTSPIKSRLPNALDLYDMAGNVWEWCYDNYGDSHRIARGGSCYDIAFVLQSGFFVSCDPSYAHNSFGFRPVRTE